MSRNLAEQIGAYTGRRMRKFIKRLTSKKRRRRRRDIDDGMRERYRGYTD